MALSADLIAIFKAGRFWKNAPLLLTFISGMFVMPMGHAFDGNAALVAAIVVMVSAFFMTHVNVITDHELDKQRKPHLFNYLNRNMSFTRWVVAAEALVSLALMLLLYRWGYGPTALALLAFGLAAVLYSYNFLMPVGDLPVKHRLKVYWWGHFIVLIVGYVALWLAGYFLVVSGVDGFWPVCFLLLSLSEYSLFLLESSIDTTEEKQQGIRSLSAILGFKHTNLVAILINLAAIVGVGMLLMDHADAARLALCFLPAMLLRLGYEAFMYGINDAEKRYVYLRKWPDVLFNFTRLYILISLILL